jgi:uncharacterized protein
MSLVAGTRLDRIRTDHAGSLPSSRTPTSALMPCCHLLLAFCVWAIVLIPPTAAAQADAGFERDIRKLLELMGSQVLSEQMVAAASDNYTTVLRAARPDLPARAFEIANEVTKAAYAKATQANGALTARIVALYAQHFTHDDVRALIAFYETETGRKLVTVLPSLAQDAIRSGQEWALEVAPEIGAEIERRLRAEGFTVDNATARPGGLVRASRVDEAPVILREVKPQYTEAAIANGIEGQVIVECIVQVDGGAEGCKVVRSLDPGLDQEAIKAARQWRFVPAKQNGSPVPVVVTVELAFTLKAEPRAGAGLIASAGPPPVVEIPAPPVPPGFAKGEQDVLEGKMGLAPARLAFRYRGDGAAEADLTVEGYYGFRQPLRLTGSLVGVSLRLSAGDVKLEGTFNGRKVTGSFQFDATTGGTFTLSGR